MSYEKEQGYNGWKNYETWVVNLWMDNDEASYSYWNDAAKEAKKVYEKEEDAEYALAKRLKHEYENAAEEASEDNKGAYKGVFGDLLNAALSEVDWDEIAKAKLDEVSESKKLVKV